MNAPKDNVTGSDELSPKQLEAINLLSTGMTQVAVSEAIEVHRVTVSNWARKDPRFRAELNRRLKERAEATAVRMQSLVEASLEVLETSIKRDQDSKVASQVLRLAGAQGYLGGPPAGPATFEEAAVQVALEDEHRNRMLRVVLAATEPSKPQPHLIDAIMEGTRSTARESASARKNGKSANGKAPVAREKGPQT